MIFNSILQSAAQPLVKEGQILALMVPILMPLKSMECQTGMRNDLSVGWAGIRAGRGGGGK